MGNYNEIYLALPMTKLPELARQMGEAVPLELEANIAVNAELFPREDGYDSKLDELLRPLSIRIAAGLAEVPDPFEHADGSSSFMGIYNNEADPTYGSSFVGLFLHSTYSDVGIPEAQASWAGCGYLITPDLLAATERLRQKLVGLAPIFADASLMVELIHW